MERVGRDTVGLGQEAASCWTGEMGRAEWHMAEPCSMAQTEVGQEWSGREPVFVYRNFDPSSLICISRP